MNNDVTLRDYLRVLWSGRYLILALALIAAVIGLLTTLARPTTYTASTTVRMGQPTTVSGVPVQTALTVPATATTVLLGDDYVGPVAQKAGVSPSVVRGAVTLSAPRVTGASAGNQPTVLTITATHGSREKAIAIANAYADVALEAVNGPFQGILNAYKAQRDAGKAQVQQLQDEVASLRRQLTQAAGTPRGDSLQIALLSATDQLRGARLDATTAEINLIKAKNNEAPAITSRATEAASSAAASQRVRTVVFSALVGLIIGIIATFVWRGSPAGRAREA